MFNSSQNRSNPWLPNPTLYYSPQIPQFLSPNYTTIDPFGLNQLTNIRKPVVDLELRLGQGQVGDTISNDQVAPMAGVSKNLALTFGRTWLDSYIRRGRGRPKGSGTRTRRRRPTLSSGSNRKEPKRCDRCGPLLDLNLNKEQANDEVDETQGPTGSGTRTRRRRPTSSSGSNRKEPCERCGPLLDLDLNKEQANDEVDETQGSVGTTTSSNRKRDYYGPCVRCGMVFDISQRYASHMRAHYLMDETKEEKMVRLAKKRIRLN